MDSTDLRGLRDCHHSRVTYVFPAPSALSADFRFSIAICGWIADRTSNRSILYFVGLFMLGGSTITFGFARASWVLVISRLFQGLSAAIVYTVGLALLVDTVGRKNIGQWMGMALSSSCLGLIISPLLGGIVYSRAGYHAVFVLILALISVDIVMRLVMIEKKTKARYMKTRSLLGIEHESYGTLEDGAASEDVGEGNAAGSGDDVSGITTNEAAIESYVSKRSDGRNHKRVQVPTIIRLLSIPRLLAAIYGIFVNVSVLCAFDGVLPIFVKHTFHWDSLAAGLIFLCLAVPSLSGPLVGKLSDRFGPRWIVVAGCALAAPPLILLRLIDHDSVEQKIKLCILLTLCGMPISGTRLSRLLADKAYLIGFAFILIISPAAADMSFVVEEKEKKEPGLFGPGGAYAQAFALLNCSMAAATQFGPLFAGWLSQQYGWATMSMALGIFAFSGAIPSVSLLTFQFHVVAHEDTA